MSGSSVPPNGPQERTAHGRTGEPHGDAPLGPDELRQARLVHAALVPDEVDERELEALSAEGGARAELTEWIATIDRCRGALDGRRGGPDPSEAMRAARVARRVLARTTRENLGVAGDLRLVADFVTDRLRSSALLRVAAALLVVQLTVLPILAWHVLREPPAASFKTGFEPPPVPLPDEAEESERIPIVAPGGGDALAELDRLDALDSSRAALAALPVLVGERIAVDSGNAQPSPGDWSADGPARAATRVGELLEARMRAASGVLVTIPAATDELERVLRAELLIDLFVLEQRWVGLADALDEVAAIAAGEALRRPADRPTEGGSSVGTSGALAQLASRTLARAGLLGLGPDAGAETRASSTEPNSNDVDVTTSGVVDPLSPEARAALASGLAAMRARAARSDPTLGPSEGDLLADPVVRAWVAAER